MPMRIIGTSSKGRGWCPVGNVWGLGKKDTALALFGAVGRRGMAADFRASGQTGIMIAGGGIPMDAVVSDFEAGAAELLSPDADADHWDIIEGQGALTHPAYAAVSLGLLHGSQPDVFVVCHERSEEHTSELQSLMRISYAVFCLNKKKVIIRHSLHNINTKDFHN